MMAQPSASPLVPVLSTVSSEERVLRRIFFSPVVAPAAWVLLDRATATWFWLLCDTAGFCVWVSQVLGDLDLGSSTFLMVTAAVDGSNGVLCALRHSQTHLGRLHQSRLQIRLLVCSSNPMCPSAILWPLISLWYRFLCRRVQMVLARKGW
jgi:hypothetical protein